MLRKFVYLNQERDGCCKNSDLSDSIRKVRHGNLNNSITAAGSRKYEKALSRIERIDTFTTNYEDAIQIRTPIDKPKKAICEITPGFLKDNNLRIVYEALKVKKTKYTNILYFLRSFSHFLHFIFTFHFMHTGLSIATNNSL